MIGAPTVVSIVLAPGVIVPAAGYTGATIDVIITLSEAPKAFTAADHLNVTEATVADPVALNPQNRPRRDSNPVCAGRLGAFPYYTRMDFMIRQDLRVAGRLNHDDTTAESRRMLRMGYSY